MQLGTFWLRARLWLRAVLLIETCVRSKSGTESVGHVANVLASSRGVDDQTSSIAKGAANHLSIGLELASRAEIGRSLLTIRGRLSASRNRAPAAWTKPIPD